METGSKIGRYEVLRKIGAGGMGEVYLANDSTLGRDVALKVLPSEFSSDTERLTRFRQEARAVSALNHPNILTIYEIGESDAGWFIATEFVKGETLRQLMNREKSLSVKQTLKIAVQIADALVSAHEAGIIHRDIKPENLMIRRDGYVKVLDFGLAKPTQVKSAPENATLQIINTTPGLVMGSVRYMSPEQARGKDVDERTDLWSFGVVLYEMIIGKPPFEGETASDTIAALIYKDVPQIFETLPDAPTEINRIVRKALRKDKTERYQTAKDLALDLQTLREDLEHGHSGENKTEIFAANVYKEKLGIHQTNSANQPAYRGGINPNSTADSGVVETKTLNRKSSRLPLYLLLAAIPVFVVIGLFVSQYQGAKRNLSATVFQKPQITKLAADGKARVPAISPDGKYVAFVSGEVGSRSLIVRVIATGSLVTLIAPTAQQITSVDFAPDGDFVYYVLRDKGGSIGTLYRIPTFGGESGKIIEDVDSGLTFSPDGKRFAFLRHVSDDGSDFIVIADTDGANEEKFISSKDTKYNFFNGLAWSPDGEKFVITIGDYKDSNREINIAEVSIKDKSIKVIGNQKWVNANYFRWFSDGSGLVFIGSDNEKSPSQIWNISFPMGEARRITNDTSQYTFFSAAGDDATLVSVSSTFSSSIWTFTPANKELVQLRPENRLNEAGSGFTQTQDGKVFYTREDENEVNIYKSDVDGKNSVRLTSGAKYNLDVTATRDGKFLVFVSNRNNLWRIWRMDSDGKNAVQITEGENVGDSRPSISADDSTVVFSRQIGNNGRAS
ncbi:MAG: protein kinase, partial [Pyrinomonadaceae bacterium]|nr:protein kinase [Pyrinomonadaceae bacterium]